MKITRKTKISFIAGEKNVSASPNETGEIVFCHRCAAEMIPAQIFTEYFGFSSRAIYRLIEADKIHFLETQENQIFLCPKSVAETFKKTL